LVVLGASNLALSLPTVVAAARAALGGPVEILATPGHGRSYGLSTTFLWRQLPSIVSCGLWDELGRRSADTTALVTDIGNDLMFEATREQIIGWVETCLSRLAAAGARIVMTRLPLGSLRRTPPHRYRLLRRLFYPFNRTEPATMLARAEELDHAIESLARRRGVALVDLPKEWYGFDPIHVRRSMRRAAWLAMLAPQNEVDAAGLDEARWRERLYLRRMRPHQRRIFGRTQHCPQPAGKLADGTTVALY
jgi:hypothetical protein